MNKYQNESSLLSHVINENVQLHREILKNMETIEHLKSREYYLEKKISELKEILGKISKLVAYKNASNIENLIEDNIKKPLTGLANKVYNTTVGPITYDGPLEYDGSNER